MGGTPGLTTALLRGPSHPSCPRMSRKPPCISTETAWNVSVSVRGLQLHLHLTSSVPAAFSAALCQRRGRQCEPEAPFYTVTQVSVTGLGGDMAGTDPR